MKQQPDNGISKIAVTIIAAMSSFLTPFASSTVNIALPSIDKELGLDAVALSWVATSYLLAAAAFLVPFGRIADIYGRKKIFLIGIIIIAAASVLCALANSGPLLIAGRVLQGLGSAMIFGTSIAILTSVFPAQERGRALGINIAAVYLGLSVGPFIGGFLTQHPGWRSIFYLSAFLGLIVIVTTLWKLKGEWAESKGEKFDLTGSIIYGLMLVAIIYGFSVLPELWGIWLILLGVIGLIVFVRWEIRLQYPVMNIAFWAKNSAFRFSNLAALINYSSTNSVTFLLSLYLQYIKKFPPEQAGLILMAQPVVMVIFAPISGHFSDKIEPSHIASIGMAFTTMGLIMLIFLNDSSSVFYVLISLIIIGLGFGLFSAPNTNAIMSAVDKRSYGVASGTVGTMRLIGQMFSMGLAMLLFSLYIGRVQISPEYYTSFLKSMNAAFIISAVLCSAGIIFSVAGKTNKVAMQVEQERG